MYISVKQKFIISVVAAIAWAWFSIYVASPWIESLADIFGYFLAYFVIYGIAIIPGFINAFLVASLLLDKRPKKKELLDSEYPDITILVAAFNEESNIEDTIESIAKQNYPGNLITYIVSDGSTDNTNRLVEKKMTKYHWLKLLGFKEIEGKALALNKAIDYVETDLMITIDADSYLYKNALKNIVARYKGDPENTAAVAGALLVRNSRKNLVTKMQEWDYFHGIAAVKRLQSLYQGTLVAQGAFSLYETKVIKEIGKYPHTVGEDIVLTWGILKQGYRVGFAEDACLFTNAPDTWKQFIRQRQRWSRGLVEAFKEHWQLLFKPKIRTLFIWWNLLFPYLDLVYSFAFLPGIIAALFGIYWIAGPMTLIVLPLALIVNYVMFRIQSKMFEAQGLKVRKNPIGFIFYAFLYSAILQPACCWGYIKELVCGKIKNWGTK